MRDDRAGVEWMMLNCSPRVVAFQVANDELRRLAVAADPGGRLWVILYAIRLGRERPVTTFPAKARSVRAYRMGSR